ncbi:unnamed protein product [Adineta steineri]|uniref:NHL repeat containing protein n=1 Tax=Adineta steineri TaxID=433720 RepID=A0A813UYW5_9BILA|nr:unnamed protein product [Adineta steineri]CAF4092489.1 unnamed protein product [Adineta steineri]
MAYLYLLCMYYFIWTTRTNASLSTIGNVYYNMSYNSTDTIITSLTVKYQVVCAAQCANLFVNCNTAVFDSLAIPQCSLYSGRITPANLTVSINAIVYDFQQSKIPTTPILHGWNKTGITVAGASNGSAGTAPNLLSNPYGTALGSFNSLYIADFANNRIQRWLINGSNDTTMAGLSNATAGASSVALNIPVSVVLDSNDNMYFTDRNNHRVVYWANGASSGTTIAGITGTSGFTNNTFNWPCAITRDSSTGTLYIADTYNHRIMKYFANASSGTVVAGGNGAGTGITQLYYPYGFTFDSSSNSLLIANYHTNNIVRWVLGASSWTLVIGSPTGLSGSTSTLLNQPVGIALDSMSNIYVADSKNHRIQFFVAGQSNGTTAAGVTGSSGISPSQLNSPYWVIIDNQLNLYVSDHNNNRVQFFSHH